MDKVQKPERKILKSSDLKTTGMKSSVLYTQMWNWLKENDKMINKFLENFIATVFLNLVSTIHLTPKATFRPQTH